MVAHLKLLIAKLKRDRFGASVRARPQAARPAGDAARGTPRPPQPRTQPSRPARGAGDDDGASVHARQAGPRAVAGASAARAGRVAVTDRVARAAAASSSKLGETITETLESIPRSYKVIQTVREKFSCRSCETITQPPAPFHADRRAAAPARTCWRRSCTASSASISR